MEYDLNAEVGGNGLYRTRELGVGGTEIVILHNSVSSATVGALNGIQLGVGLSWLKAFEDKTVGVAIATIRASGHWWVSVKGNRKLSARKYDPMRSHCGEG
jgi:hypothetical protein